jgi:hypothetical protein
MAWVFLAMGTFCATDWPEVMVSLIFYFLLTLPECAWVTQNPGLMPDPRTWVMPVGKWGVMDRKRLWKFHVSSKLLFFWAYDEFDEALRSFWSVMDDMVEHYTNPERELCRTLTVLSWDLSWGWGIDVDDLPQLYIDDLWQMYEEELDRIWASVALTTSRIEYGREHWS